MTPIFGIFSNLSLLLMLKKYVNANISTYDFFVTRNDINQWTASFFNKFVILI